MIFGEPDYEDFELRINQIYFYYRPFFYLKVLSLFLFLPPNFFNDTTELCSYKRPGLDAFINFCFTHFQSVSLWTAGTQEYAEFIARSTAPPGYQYMFVLSRIHCRDHPLHEGTLVKDMNGILNTIFYHLSFLINTSFPCFLILYNLTEMKDLWQSDVAKTFNINEDNSFIVDDNEDYCYCNQKNAIVIKTWKFMHASDFTFPKLISYLEKSDADSAASLCWGAA